MNRGLKKQSTFFPIRKLHENAKSLSSRRASPEQRKVKSNMNVIKSMETRLSLPEISD